MKLYHAASSAEGSPPAIVSFPIPKTKPAKPRITACVCRFKRTEHGKWERGVNVGRGSVIVDSQFKTVKKVWDYKLLEHEGCFQFEP